MVIIHLAFFLSPKAKVNEDGEMSKFNQYWDVLRTRTLEFFMYSYYARLILETDQNLILSSLGEFDADFPTAASVWSLMFGILMFVVCLCLITLIFIIWFRSFRKFDPEKKTYFMEFFADLKNTQFARFYTPMLVFRRFLWMVIALEVVKIDRSLTFSLLLVLQIAYLIVISIMRPFNLFKNNLVETINEVFLLGWVCFFFGIDEESKWSFSKQYVFLVIMTANTLSVCAIIIGKYLLLPTVYSLRVDHHLEVA